MVLLLDGKSEIGAHVIENLCYLICLRILIRSRAVTNQNFYLEKKPIFLHATCSKLSSNIITVAVNGIHIYVCWGQKRCNGS